MGALAVSPESRDVIRTGSQYLEQLMCEPEAGVLREIDLDELLTALKLDPCAIVFGSRNRRSVHEESVTIHAEPLSLLFSNLYASGASKRVRSRLRLAVLVRTASRRFHPAHVRRSGVIEIRGRVERLAVLGRYHAALGQFPQRLCAVFKLLNQVLVHLTFSTCYAEREGGAGGHTSSIGTVEENSNAGV